MAVATSGLAGLAGLAGCSSSQGVVIGEPSASAGATVEDKTVRITYPIAPPIRVPDLSEAVAAGGATSSQALAELAAPSAGVDLVSPVCTPGGTIVPGAAPDLFKLDTVADYVALDGDKNLTVTTAKDGTKHYVDLGGKNNLTLDVHPDGSGSVTNLGGDNNLSLRVNKDGSGELTDLGGDRNFSVKVASDGSGTLTDLTGDRNLHLTVDPKGHGTLTDLGGDRNLSLEIPGGGNGKMTDLGGQKNITLIVDGAAADYTDLTEEKNLHLILSPDGGVSYTDQTGPLQLELTVAADGSGTYRDGDADVEFAFDSSGKATDGSGYRIVLPPKPTFYVDEQIPKLGKLARLSPPCARVLRFAADALFDFDKADLKPSGQALIAKAAATLNQLGTPIEVDGHTDAKGDDAYNDDLSQRRAASFAAGLKAAGVTVTITTKGYGEKHPVAPNTTASGQDNPAGRALNRRVEVVIGQ